MLSVQNAGIEKLISGQLKPVQVMKLKLDSFAAQNASIPGESIIENNVFILSFLNSSMKIIFTNHAKHRMIERDIKIEKIKEAIELPDYTITKDGKIESYKRIENKTLKIVYIKKDKFIKIVTLIWK